MQRSSTTSTAHFASSVHSQPPTNSPAPQPSRPSQINPSPTSNNTQFSFRKLNTIQEVSEPSTSVLASVLRTPILISAHSQTGTSRFTQGNMSVSHTTNAPSFFKKVSNLAQQRMSKEPPKLVRTIVTPPPPKGYQPPPLQRIQEERESVPQRYWETEGVCDKIRRWFDSCNCCKGGNQYRGISTAW